MEDKDKIEKLFNQCTLIGKNKLKKYTIEFKLNVLELLELNVSLHEIESRLGISRKSIRDWRNKKKDLLDISNKPMRYRCLRTKGLNTALTEEESFKVKNWIIENRKKFLPISTKSLVSYVGTINDKFREKNIKVKLRWAYRFLKRNGFSIRRISHRGQFIPREHSEIKANFIKKVIEERKNLNIDYNDDFRIINMDETPCYLDMSFETTIDFTGNKNIDIKTDGREKYRISVILSVAGDGTKLPPLVIFKGEEGKTIEKSLNTLYYVKNKKIFVHCQREGWCTSEIFAYWINEIFLPYENEISEKCLLIMDNASSHISNTTLKVLEDKKVSFIQILSGMTPECQPFDISVNKKFKDKIILMFENNRILFDTLNNKVKLKTARLNLLDYIYRVWDDKTIITKNDIINGFKHSGIIGNAYFSIEEEKINKGYLYDIIGQDTSFIIDDLGKELSLNDDDIENMMNNEEEEENDDDNNIEENNNFLKNSKGLDYTENSMYLDIGKGEKINKGNTQNSINLSNNSINVDQEFNLMIKENLNDLNNNFNSQKVIEMKNEIEKMDLDD